MRSSICSFNGSRTRPLTGLVLAGLVLLTSVIPARNAQAQDDILMVGKSALYGAATGLLLGGVTALVVDSNDRGDAIRWGIVLGTFGGFAYGIYKVSRSDDDMFLREPGGHHFGDAATAREHLQLAELTRPPIWQAVDWTVASRAPVSYLGPWPSTLAPEPHPSGAAPGATPLDE